MRKTIFSVSIIVLAVVLCGSIIKRDTKDINGQIYYIDHSMLRLIPIDVNLGKVTKQRAAKVMIDRLIDNKNPKTLNLLPDEEGCIDVDVKGNTAIVDLKKTLAKNKPENRTHGLLMVYSIVNSLTSIDGIDTVKFLVDGKEEKNYISGLDMREVFIPDYYM